jgi:ankyrin repeat protein
MNTLPQDITSIIAGFSDWVDAVYTGNTELALFLHETFHINVHQLLRDDHYPRFHKYNEPKQDMYRYPLEMAVIAGNKTIVGSLLQSGANPNEYNLKENKPVLFQAYFRNFDTDHELMTLLIQHHANIINTTLHGKNLLWYAIERDDVMTVHFCLMHGIHDLSVIHGNMYESSDTDILEALLDHGLSANSIHTKHGSLLHEAVRIYKQHIFHIDTRFIQLLLEKGADPLVLYNNESPLSLLRPNDFYSYEDALLLLFEYGVNPEKDTTISYEYRETLIKLYHCFL